MASDIIENSFIFYTVCCVIVCIIALLALLAYSVSYKFPEELYYDECPSLAFLYLKGLCVGFKRKQGFIQSDLSDGDAPRIFARDCRLDQHSLTSYAIVCGYGDKPLAVPPCYLECYFLPLIIGLVTSDKFKLSPLGLIHIGQSISQHADLHHLLKEPFDMECCVAKYTETAKGVEVDINMKVYDRREMCVWEGCATLLSRTPQTTKNAQQQHQGSTITDSPSDRRQERIVARHAADLGVRYARTSGDWNPHHLWPWTARLLGYKAPIAHGMWTLSRCITWLDVNGKLPMKAPVTIRAQFKRPVFLPSSSVFTFTSQLAADHYKFHVTDEASGAPQVIGAVRRETD